MNIQAIKTSLIRRKFESIDDNEFFSSFDADSQEDAEDAANSIVRSLGSVHPNLTKHASISVSDPSYESDVDEETGSNAWYVATITVNLDDISL